MCIYRSVTKEKAEHTKTALVICGVVGYVIRGQFAGWETSGRKEAAGVRDDG